MAGKRAANGIDVSSCVKTIVINWNAQNPMYRMVGDACNQLSHVHKVTGTKAYVSHTTIIASSTGEPAFKDTVQALTLIKLARTIPDAESQEIFFVLPSRTNIMPASMVTNFLAMVTAEQILIFALCKKIPTIVAKPD